MKSLALFDDGHHVGPLFEIRKKRSPKPAMRDLVRHRHVRKQTPKWADVKAIRVLYKAARYLTAKEGEPYNVDHIVPLSHPLVCGLHVPANLRVIHWRDNAAKSNLFWPDMPFEQKEFEL